MTVVIPKIIVVFLLLIGGVSQSLATTILVVNNDGSGEGFNDLSAPFSGQTNNTGATLGAQRLQVFQAAADYWETKLISNVTIRVGAEMNSLFCNSSAAVLGSAGPNFIYRDFPNAPLANTWYVEGVANSLAGSDRDPGANDISAEFNSNIDNNNGCLNNTNWWLGIGAPAPFGTISLYDTVLHEIAHGLGVVSLVNGGSGAKTGGLNDAYMYNLYDETSNQYWRNMSNTQRVSSSTNTGNLVWRGTYADSDSAHITAGKTNGHLRMYAPNPYEGGSSVSHWDTAISPDELMEPLATPTSDDRSTVKLLKDVGWPIVEGPGTIGFTGTQYHVWEDSLSVTISVSRTLGADGAASVIVNSSSGSATGGGIDYTDITSLGLSWADGELGVKTFSVVVTDDDIEELGGEVATLSLSSFVGGVNQGTVSAVLKISDPDKDDLLLLVLPAIISAATK